MNKKQIESFHFKLFRELFANFPEGEVWHEDEPDFLVHTSNGILGIEHCRVFQPTPNGKTPVQAIENQTDEILSLAIEHAELRGLPEIHATFSFNLTNSLKKNERLEIAREIARLIHDKLKSEKPTGPYGQVDVAPSELPGYLDLIHFIKVKRGMRNRWHCARPGWAMKQCRSVIEDAINKKAEKYQNYLKKCKQCWLLLVAETNPSSFLHPNAESCGHVYLSPFERIYFLDCAPVKLFPLKSQSE